MEQELRELARAVKRLQWRHHRAIDGRLRAEGATIMQWDALRAMDREPGASARRLASETFQTEQSFGVMAAGMERKGLIERSSGAGRLIEHRLTDAGRAVLERGNAIASEEVRGTVGRLEGPERTVLLDLLRRAAE